MTWGNVGIAGAGGDITIEIQLAKSPEFQPARVTEQKGDIDQLGP